MPTVSTSIKLDGVPCVINSAEYQALGAARKANGYWCPVGPMPGRAWLLMVRSAVAAVADGSAHTLTFAQGATSAALRGLYFDKAERLGTGGIREANAVYLAEFADVRALLCKFTDTGNIAANIRSYAQDDDYLTDYDGYTWSSLASEIWGKLPSGLVGSFPGLPYSPDGSPNNFRWIGQNAWDALHELLEKINCTTAFNPVAGTFSIVQIGATQAIPAGLGTPLWDGEPFDGALDVPATIRVYFPIHHKNYGQERDTEVTTNWVTEEAGYSIDVATGVSGAVAGTILPLWDDLPRVLDEDNSVTNGSALTSRANERAAKWVTERNQSANVLHRVYAGPQSSLLPGSLNKAVLWRHWGDGHVCATEVVRHSDMPRGYEEGKTLWQPRRELLLPPDIGRKTFPNYPRLPNIVQVWDGGADDGHAVSPNASGLFPARVRRWVAGALATLGTCWLRIALTNPATIANGECFMGRLSGVETNSSDRRPVYLAVSGGSAAECDCSVAFIMGRLSDGDPYTVENGAGAIPLSGWDAITNTDPACDWYFTYDEYDQSGGGEIVGYATMHGPNDGSGVFVCHVSTKFHVFIDEGNWRRIVIRAERITGAVSGAWSDIPEGLVFHDIHNATPVGGITHNGWYTLTHTFKWTDTQGARIRFKVYYDTGQGAGTTYLAIPNDGNGDLIPYYAFFGIHFVHGQATAYGAPDGE